MFQWLQNIFRGQEQGYIRTGAGIIAPPDVFTHNYADSGVTVDKNTCFALPAFKRAVELIANKVAHCRCHVLKELPSGGREFAKEHPAYRLIRKQANPYLSPVEVFRSLVTDAIWNGNSFCWIQKIGDLPAALWLLPPENVTPVVVHQPTTQTLVYVVHHNEGRTALDASEVVHIKGLSTTCGLIGMRLIDYARESLGLGLATQRYASAFYRHGGMSDAWIETPEGSYLDEEAQKQILGALNRMFSGVDRSHSAIVLTGGAKLNKTYLNNSDAQFLESRQFTLIDVANLVGIDPSFIGGATNTSYKSLQEIGTASLSNSFNPWLSAIEQQLEAKLLKESEKEEFYIEFDRSDLTRGDAKSETENWVLKVTNNLASIEEYRRANNLPTDNLKTETFLRPSNLVDPNEPPPEHAQPLLNGPPQAEPEETEGEVERGQRDAVSRAALTRLINRIRTDAPTSKDALFSRHYPTFVDALPLCRGWVDSFMEELGSELESVLPEQQAAVLARLDADKLAGELWTE